MRGTYKVRVRWLFRTAVSEGGGGCCCCTRGGERGARQSKREARRAACLCSCSTPFRLLLLCLNVSSRALSTPPHPTPRTPSSPHQGREGKVTTVYRRKWVIHINGLTREKVNGSQAPVPIQPSKCVITKLKLDKDRQAILARKGKGGGAGGKGKFSEAEVEAMEAVE